MRWKGGGKVFWRGRKEKKGKEKKGQFPGFRISNSNSNSYSNPNSNSFCLFLFSSPGRVLAILLACGVLYCIVLLLLLFIEKGSIAGRQADRAAARTGPGLARVLVGYISAGGGGEQWWWWQ